MRPDSTTQVAARHMSARARRLAGDLSEGRPRRVTAGSRLHLTRAVPVSLANGQEAKAPDPCPGTGPTHRLRDSDATRVLGVGRYSSSKMSYDIAVSVQRRTANQRRSGTPRTWRGACHRMYCQCACTEWVYWLQLYCYTGYSHSLLRRWSHTV